jgi:hypothetical protein
MGVAAVGAPMILTRIVTGFQLDAPAAASYARASTAFGSPLPVTSAYRSTAEQRALYDGWIRRRPGYNFALPPGQSVHELGLAVDFTPAAYTWLETNAAEFGWHSTNPLERWHYEYMIGRDRHLADATPTPGGPAALPPIPAPLTPPEDDTMKPFIMTGNSSAPDRGIALVRPWLIGEDAVRVFNAEEWAIYAAKVQPLARLDTVALSAREWDVLKAFHTYRSSPAPA